MTLRLYYHPLASFCQKVLIALYEDNTPFTPQIVDLADERQRADFVAVWPIGKFPVLRDETREQTIPESTTIIEYLAQHYPGVTPFIPENPDDARETRLRDRLFDLYLNMPMQKIVADRLRPDDRKDPLGVEEARDQIRTALGILDGMVADRTWAMGERFTMADCAAAPALFYVDKVMPFRPTHPNAAAYFDRLAARASFSRVMADAAPYLRMFPG